MEALPLPPAIPTLHASLCFASPQAGRRSLDSGGLPMHLKYEDDRSAEPTHIEASC